MFLLVSLGMDISVAGSVLVAQYTEAGAERQAERDASQTVTFAALASVLLGGVGYPLCPRFPLADGCLRGRVAGE
jgi:Na+-driven multidrug efflux pump